MVVVRDRVVVVLLLKHFDSGYHCCVIASASLQCLNKDFANEYVVKLLALF